MPPDPEPTTSVRIPTRLHAIFKQRGLVAGRQVGAEITLALQDYLRDRDIPFPPDPRLKGLDAPPET